MKENSSIKMRISDDENARRTEKMPVVEELIRAEADGSLSFGNYKLEKKTKLDNFEQNGDLYKIKTFHEITKLEGWQRLLLRCLRIARG